MKDVYCYILLKFLQAAKMLSPKALTTLEAQVSQRPERAASPGIPHLLMTMDTRVSRAKCAGNIILSCLFLSYRNPSGWSGGVWCYTLDPAVRWEVCDVPLCQTGEQHRPALEGMADIIFITVTNKVVIK